VTEGWKGSKLVKNSVTYFKAPMCECKNPKQTVNEDQAEVASLKDAGR